MYDKKYLSNDSVASRDERAKSDKESIKIQLTELNQNRVEIASSILKEDGLRLILSNVDKIFNFIELKKGEFSNKKINIDSNKDNVISIIGERGSGKTSVLKTIKYIIEKLKTIEKPNCENFDKIVDDYSFLKILDKNNLNISITNQSNESIHCINCKLKTDCKLIENIEDINKCPFNMVVLTKKINENRECKYNFTKDILVDIIKPEIFDQNDLLGFMIGHLRDHEKEANLSWKNFSKTEKKDYYNYSKFENKNKNNEIISCNFLENPIREKYKKLQHMYIKRKEEYKELVRERGFENIDKYMDDITDILYSDACIITKFKDFIKELILFKEFKSGIKNICLYMFFDDMDLCNKEHEKILKTILNFFMIDRIIVFISADMESLQSKLTLEYLNSENLLNKDLLEIDFGNSCKPIFSTAKNNSAFRRYNTLAIDFINKIMAPKNRYYLSNLNRDQIINFQPNQIGNDNRDGFFEIINLLINNTNNNR